MPHHYYGPAMSSLMQMMAPSSTHSPAHASQTSQFSDPPATTNQDSGAQRRKKNQWSDTEERIQIKLFRENEDRASDRLRQKKGNFAAFSREIMRQKRSIMRQIMRFF